MYLYIDALKRITCVRGIIIARQIAEKSDPSFAMGHARVSRSRVTSRESHGRSRGRARHVWCRRNDTRVSGEQNPHGTWRPLLSCAMRLLMCARACAASICIQLATASRAHRREKRATGEKTEKRFFSSIPLQPVETPT